MPLASELTLKPENCASYSPLTKEQPLGCGGCPSHQRTVSWCPHILPMRIRYDPKLKNSLESSETVVRCPRFCSGINSSEDKMLGYQFMRQKPIQDYIVDFYCSKLRLVIEIDGDSHRERFAKDLRRQQELERMGLHFLRFHDLDVKKDMVNVLRCIQNWIECNDKTTP